MKFNRLFEQDFKIVENKKKVFIAPLVVLAIAVIMCIIFGCVTGNVFNIGMDFTGGYSMTVEIGNQLTDETYDYYKDLATDVAENLTDENGDKYGIKISSVQKQGDTEKAGLLLKYKAVAEETEMEAINNKLRDELSNSMFFFRPDVKFNNDKTEFTATYDGYLLIGDYGLNAFSDRLEAKGYGVSSVAISEDLKTATIKLTAAVADDKVSEVSEIMTISNDFGGTVSDGGQTSSTVSGEILKSALLAISIALLCMLIYIVIRFELLSGIAAVVALAHDILMMVCFMAIFHIEINSTFIAALITILGYSINNTIIIFDRVRENMKIYANKRIDGKMVKPAYIANKSVQETVWRSINTTLTTLVTIGMVAIIGVPDIRTFALPIIFGLLAGTYSSIFLAPTIWAMLAKAFPGTVKAKGTKAPKAKREKAQAEK